MYLQGTVQASPYAHTPHGNYEEHAMDLITSHLNPDNLNPAQRQTCRHDHCYDGQWAVPLFKTLHQPFAFVLQPANPFHFSISVVCP